MLGVGSAEPLPCTVVGGCGAGDVLPTHLKLMGFRMTPETYSCTLGIRYWHLPDQLIGTPKKHLHRKEPCPERTQV